MKKLEKRVAAFIAASSLFLQVAAPLAASTTTLEIVGNGRGTDNTVSFTTTNTTSVVQSNNAEIDNYVAVEANTGDNTAEDNVGGDVSVTTGDVEVDAEMANTANSNVANVSGCCEVDVNATIEGNAAETSNVAVVDSVTATDVYQMNNADVENTVEVSASTGDNDAKDNLGGDVSVETGDVKVKPVKISNSLNSNSADVGGSGGVSASAYIVGNGRESDNTISLGLLRQSLVVQDNNADVENYVGVEAETGDNTAEDNVGGDVSIDTGDVDVSAEFDTMSNFNWADVGCDCLADTEAKIGYNLKDSENVISGNFASLTGLFQSNCGDSDMDFEVGGQCQENGDCEIENGLEVSAATGDNDAKDNGGDVGGDPSIETGDVTVSADYETSGNSNVFGDDEPEGVGMSLPGGFFLQISLDWSDIMNWAQNQ